MRTIRLKEHQPEPTKLSSAELTEVLTTGKYLTITKLPQPDMYALRPGSTVGTLVLGSVRILIKPKVDLHNLFYLLGFGVGLTEWASQRFPYEKEPDLFHAIGWAFEAEVERGLRQGLVRGYLRREEDLVTVRGRIDLARQMRVRQDRVLPLACLFEEYTEDIELNQVLKAAHRRLRLTRGIDPDLSRRLLFRQRSFADVADVEYSQTLVPTLEFNRLNEYWKAAGRLAELILRQETLLDQTGAVAGAAFTVDMNKLFERFVTRIFRAEAAAAGLELDDQAKRWLTEDIRMKPDLVLVSHGLDHAVGDVKYKKLEVEDWPHADLYQLLAYCSAMGLPRGLLIYANFQNPEHHVVRRTGTELETIGIDMRRPPSELESQAKEAARILIGHARRLQAEAA